MNTYKNEEIKNNANISEGFQTIPNPETKRFIIKIPKIDDKFLDDTSHVLNYKNEPTGINRGILFKNGVDKTNQLVEANGNGILIINNVTKNQSVVLTELSKILEDLQDSGEKYVNAFKNLINECNSIGLIDKYNSTIDYMEKNLRKDPDSNTYVRTNDALTAYIAKEEMIIEGANGTSIENPEFTKEYNEVSSAYYRDGLGSEVLTSMVLARFPDLKEFIIGQTVNAGDVLLETKEGDFRKIDREVFKETYLNMDGNKFNEETLNEIALKDKQKELSMN